MSARPRSLAVILLVALLAPVTLIPVDAVAAEPPSVRLFVTSDELTVERDRRDVVFVTPGAWLTPVGGTFELRVSRPDYDTPVTIKQVDANTGQVLRTIGNEHLDGWSGLAQFGHVEVVNAQGRILLAETMSFCPNGYGRQRLSDDSPITSRYPYTCFASSPFTRGMIWGMDAGWANSLLGDPYYALRWKAERRNYTVRVNIEPVWVDLLGIAPADASAEIHVTVVDRGTLSSPAGAARGDAPDGSAAPFPRTPIVDAPDPDSVPDLVALPGWGMSAYRSRGRDYLAFNATEWNAGPGTMVVEGFRDGDEETMDAFQYFLVDEEPVGRAPVGQLEFHRGGGHNHWHFEEFTRYSLLDASSNEIVRSGKQSWCLVNTDAIDLTLPNAKLFGYEGDIATSCGFPGALWVREVLDVGWGDTYSQSVRGQAFDITNLPNGRYFVRVHVNPTGALFETTTANNVEDRRIRLLGTPGHRRVVVPPWHGIDTEHYCGYCG